MATESKIKTKRENTKKSTGPSKFKDKTKIKYECVNLWNFFKKTPLLPGENQEQLKLLDEETIKAYQPTDAIESDLVQRICLPCIRLIRPR